MSNFTSKADKKYAVTYFSGKLTDDRESTILNYNVTFLVDVIEEQMRVKLSKKKDAHDEKYSLLVFTTPINSCKIIKGVYATFFVRMLVENLFKSINTNYSCPFKKDVTYAFTDYIITDSFCPPMQIEALFKLEIKMFGRIKDRKGWTHTYDILGFGTYKK